MEERQKGWTVRLGVAHPDVSRPATRWRTGVLLAVLTVTVACGSSTGVAVERSQAKYLEAASVSSYDRASLLDIAEGSCGVLELYYGYEYYEGNEILLEGGPEEFFAGFISDMESVGVPESEAHTILDAVLRYQCGEQEWYDDWYSWSQ